jgi:hypothetical protein
VAGPNWLIAGEAASMVDPITANGVTAALRHAAEASELILKYRKRGTLPLKYSLTATGSCRWQSSLTVEKNKTVFEPTVRDRIGVGRAGTLYTSPAWSMNVVYSHLRPRGSLTTFLLNSFLGFFPASAWIFYQCCKWLTSSTEMAR